MENINIIAPIVFGLSDSNESEENSNSIKSDKIHRRSMARDGYSIDQLTCKGMDDLLKLKERLLKSGS